MTLKERTKLEKEIKLEIEKMNKLVEERTVIINKLIESYKI